MSDKIGIDDLAEDIFGLNVRGIRSIGTIWINPAAYFLAAREKDWRTEFTPSIRLWLSLIALTSLLQFIWIGSDTPLVSAYSDGFRNAGILPAQGMSYDDLGQQAALWIYAIAPVTQLVLFLCILAFFPFWGEKRPYGLKVRSLFAVMIPSASLLALFLPAMALVPATHLTAFGLLVGAVTFGLDAVTGYRGAFSARTGFAKAWRAGLLAFMILVLNIFANVGAQIVGIVAVSFQYGLSAG